MRLRVMRGRLIIMRGIVDMFVVHTLPSLSSLTLQIPKAMTHYVENIGTTDVIFLEVLQADHFSGMSARRHSIGIMLICEQISRSGNGSA